MEDLKDYTVVNADKIKKARETLEKWSSLSDAEKTKTEGEYRDALDLVAQPTLYVKYEDPLPNDDDFKVIEMPRLNPESVAIARKKIKGIVAAQKLSANSDSKGAST